MEKSNASVRFHPLPTCGTSSSGSAERAQTPAATPATGSPRHHCASAAIAQDGPLCALDVLKHREAAPDGPGEALAVGRGLPVIAHRNEWYVLPHLLCNYGDTTLLGKIASVEPGEAQFLDTRAVGPAVISGLAVGP
jgi:hypothetical protein